MEGMKYGTDRRMERSEGKSAENNLRNTSGQFDSGILLEFGSCPQK